MSNRMYRLPNGTETDDPDLYGDSWTILGSHLCEALNDGIGTWHMIGVGAMYEVVVARQETWNNGTREIHRDTEEHRFSVNTALHIIGLWENQAM